VRGCELVDPDDRRAPDRAEDVVEFPAHESP
jgi:hypothetical protein